MKIVNMIKNIYRDFKIELYLSFIYLKGNLKSSILAVISMGISLSALIISLGIYNGLSKNTLNNVLSVSHVKVRNNFGLIKNFKDEKSEISKMDNVSKVYPKISGKGIIKTDSLLGKYIEGIAIEAYDKEDILDLFSSKIINSSKNENIVNIKEDLNDSLKDNIKNDLKDHLRNNIKNENADNINLKEDSILIGREMADALYLKVGDIVRIVSSENKEHVFVINNIFSTGFYEYDLNVVIMLFGKAQKIFSIEGATELNIKLKDPYKIDVVKEIKIRRHLDAKSWMQLNKKLLSSIMLEKNILIFLLSLILIVTGFGIAVLVSSIVRDKTKEIGILRALGFSKRDICFSFLLLGLIFSILGSTLSLILSYLASVILKTFTFNIIQSVYYIPERIPFCISVKEVFEILFFGRMIVLLSVIFPALKASRLDPVKALKYE